MLTLLSVTIVSSVTLSGRPLLDNPVDARLFVNRAREIAALRTAVDRQFNALVTGERGIGKTSLLRAFAYTCRQEAPMTVVRYVHAAGIRDAGGLFDKAMEATIGSVTATIAAAAPALERIREQSEHGLDVRIVVVVDDVSADAGHALFGTLRDELWALPCQWIVSVQPADRGALQLPPADAFFETVVDVEPLSIDDGAELLNRRQKFSRGASHEMARAAGGNPRNILAIAREVAAEPDRLYDVMSQLSQRDSAIHKLGRPAVMLGAVLGSSGAASASDEALLNELGWTRPRVVQVLAQMEEAGVVRSADVKTAGQGRPRRVYRLATPGEYAAYQAAAARS